MDAITRLTRAAGMVLLAQILVTCTWGMDFPEYKDCPEGFVDLLTDSAYCGFRAELTGTVEIPEEEQFGGFPILVEVVEDRVVVVSVRYVVEGPCAGLLYHADFYRIDDGERLVALGGATFGSENAFVAIATGDGSTWAECGARNFQLVLPVQADMIRADDGTWLLGFAAGEAGLFFARFDEGATEFEREEIIPGDLLQSEAPGSESFCRAGQCVIANTEGTARQCRTTLVNGVAVPAHGDCGIRQLCRPPQDAVLGTCVDDACGTAACSEAALAICSEQGDICFPLCAESADCPGLGTCVIEDGESFGGCLATCPTSPCGFGTSCVEGLCVAQCEQDADCPETTRCLDGICSPRAECVTADRFGEPVAVGCGIGVASFYNSRLLSFPAATAFTFVEHGGELVALVPAGLGGLWRLSFEDFEPVGMSNVFAPMYSVTVREEVVWGLDTSGHIVQFGLGELLEFEDNGVPAPDERLANPIATGFVLGEALAVTDDAVYLSTFPDEDDPTIRLAEIPYTAGDFAEPIVTDVGPGNLSRVGYIDEATLGVVRISVSESFTGSLDFAAATAVYDLAEPEFDDPFIIERFDSATEGQLTARGVGFGDRVMVVARPDTVQLFAYQRQRVE